MKTKASCTGKPKRPPIAFILFTNEFKKRNPQLKKVTKISKAAAKEWKSLDAIGKAPYYAEYKKLMEVYDESKNLKERVMSCEQLAQRAVAAQLKSGRNGKSWDDIENAGSEQDVDLMKTHISKIQQLEVEVTRRKFSTACSNGLHDGLALDKGMHLDDIGSGCEVGTLEVSSEVDEEEKEREHSSTQEKLDMELQDLDKRLQQKEAEMKQFDTVRKQHYETKLDEMVQEKRALQKEIVDLRHAVANTSNSTDKWSNYLEKLNMIETQVSQHEKKREAHEQLLRHKQKSDDEAMRLQGEIQRIKSQKVFSFLPNVPMLS